ncbi:pectate lyase-domain-containing protein [Armillaria nabsnona]|nr:pectate lyase-domain-containing protein [Armillaria nabsnona]
MQFLLALSIASLAGLSAACDAYTGGLPTATGTVSSSAVIEVAAGETFDGGWKKYDRGSGACSDQSEGGYLSLSHYEDAGATLQNVIITANQAEGVHCTRYCTLNYVWFEDVCEDAITIKNDEAGDYTNIIGGSAYHAEDKVIQHNGCGTVNIINFFVSNYEKRYRSCGNCKSQCFRNVYISGVYTEDDKDPLHLPSFLRTIICQNRRNSCWYQLQLRRTFICIAYVFPHSSPSTNRTLLPSSIRATIPATLAPSTTVAREAASPKSSVTAVVERRLGNVACPWRAPKYTSITYITFVLSLVS